MEQLFIDSDGVLADFDSAAKDLFGQDSKKAEEHLGTEEFWKRLRACTGFYRNLSLMADAMELYAAVAHLEPIILTGCPKGGWAERQKIAWAAHHFPGTRIVTCRSKDKCLHMKNPGDVLVDDYLRYRDLWEKAGGLFVHHLSARKSVRCLSELGLAVRPSEG